MEYIRNPIDCDKGMDTNSRLSSEEYEETMDMGYLYFLHMIQLAISGLCIAAGVFCGRQDRPEASKPTLYSR